MAMHDPSHREGNRDMNDETRKYVERTIMRLQEIVNGEPFRVRDGVREFIKKLQDTLPPTKETV